MTALKDAPFWQGFFDVFKPQPILTVSQWADLYRILPRSGSSAPGPWRNARTPYLVEIMDALSPQSRTREVVFAKASQLGATEAGTNWILYSIDTQPGPFLALQPTEGTAVRWSKQRVGPSIDGCSRIHPKMAKVGGRGTGNSLLQKDYTGGTLIISGSNSPAALASMPIGNIYADEIDRYPLDAGGEGDPLDLVKQRVATYPLAKILYTSTPTELVTSKIWTLYQESDRRIYEVPCPECQQFFHITFDLLQWPTGKPEDVLLYCPHCGCGIEEYHKTRMLPAGRWVKTNPGHFRVGFHLSSLYSPLGWLSWEEIARRFESAGKDPEKRKAFQNTILGLPWEEDGEILAVEYLERRREEYTAQLPPGVMLLTMAVDVQNNRLEYEVRGWGKDEETWGIEYGAIYGDPAELTSPDPNNPTVWQRLDEQRMKGFVRSDRMELRVACTVVDSGYLSDVVYAYTKPRERFRVFSVRGSSTDTKPLLPKVSTAGKIKARIFVLGVSKGKELVYARLRLEEPGPGYFHFPKDELCGYDPAYYAGLTCERRVVKHIRGYRVMQWEKPRDARNEPLDLAVYNTAAIRILNPNWAAIALRYANINSKVVAPPKAQTTDTPQISPQSMPRPVSRIPQRARYSEGIHLG